MLVEGKGFVKLGAPAPTQIYDITTTRRGLPGGAVVRQESAGQSPRPGGRPAPEERPAAAAADAADAAAADAG